MLSKRKLISFENKISKLFLSKKIRVPIHLSGGNEDNLIAIFKEVKHGDYIFSNHRNHYHYLLHTGRTTDLMSEILGSAKGVCRGNSGSMHTTHYNSHFFSSGIVCGMVSIACGVALALKIRHRSAKVWCFVGDAATDSGWFVESVRYAIYNRLPITYVIEDNDRSVETGFKERWGVANCLRLWEAYPYVRYYNYKPKYPHVGCGKWVRF